ncbi:MAG: ATP-dependent Clp protease ATP-binding subunit [Ruminococcaceae bacterium]|nr:ATP-dependent Clp protease ATP-binding subunit [Oscillospiraceae bacterium]
MTSRFTPAAERVLNRALVEARSMGHTYVGTEHLLLGLLFEKDCVAYRIAQGRGIFYEDMRERILATEGQGSLSHIGASDLSPRARRVIERAGKEMGGAFGRIGTEQLFSSLLAEGESAALKLLAEKNVTAAELHHDIAVFQGKRPETEASPKKSEALPPTLKKYGHDLTAAALLGEPDPVIGREEETERVIRILCRRNKNNPCLIGEPGVGKTAVVEGLALRIASREVPEALLNKRLVTLDLPSMIAGAKYRGEFEERMKAVLSEAAEDTSIILFIDELHTIVGAGSAEGSVDAANIIKPALARGKLRVIGATTVTEYRRYIEKDAALERRFQPVTVEEPTEEETLSILKGLRPRYEEHHGILIPEEAMTAAIRLSVRYLPERRLPDKAIDLLDEAASGKRIASEKQSEEEKTLNGILMGLASQKEEALLDARPEDAATLDALERDYRKKLERKRETAAKAPITLDEEDITRVLMGRMGTGNALEPSLNGLEAALGRHVFGQEEAIKTVCGIVRRGMLGLAESDRPLAGMLFLGPSGVGKTELATALASAVFGSDRALLRLDMSEYTEKHCLSKLIGSPPGYVGYEEEGILTATLHRHPRTLILFDEAEKAHPEIFGLLLQILDHGFLTDAAGRRVDFRSSLIVLTSNLGSDAAAGRSVGFTVSSASADKAEELARTYFRTELIGRLDGIIPFLPLTLEAGEAIAKQVLSQLKERLGRGEISCDFAPSLPARLAKEGLSPRYGARSLKRLIRREVEDRILSYLGDHPLGEEESLLCEEEKEEIIVKTVTKRQISHILS